jgi:hypothetical protein
MIAMFARHTLLALLAATAAHAQSSTTSSEQSVISVFGIGGIGGGGSPDGAVATDIYASIVDNVSVMEAVLQGEHD